jgi:hypothetical protein
MSGQAFCCGCGHDGQHIRVAVHHAACTSCSIECLFVSMSKDEAHGCCSAPCHSATAVFWQCFFLRVIGARQTLLYCAAAVVSYVRL